MPFTAEEMYKCMHILYDCCISKAFYMDEAGRGGVADIRMVEDEVAAMCKRHGVMHVWLLAKMTWMPTLAGEPRTCIAHSLTR